MDQSVLTRLRIGPLTAARALAELNCTHLADSIFRLRIANFTIERDTIKTPTGKHIGRYRLKP